MQPRTPEIMNFFTPQNYRFSTKATGRKSTLYFQDNAGNIGRIKRAASHGGGAGLYYSGQGHRLFINFYETLRLTKESDDLPAHLEKISKKLRTGRGLDSRTRVVYSLNHTPTWRVFEFFNNRCHGSSGTVMTNDPDAKKIIIDACLFDIQALPLNH